MLILLAAVFSVPAYDHLIRAEAVRVRPNYALREGGWAAKICPKMAQMK